MSTLRFDVERFLENLLLDEHRETYAQMTDTQKIVVRFAAHFGIRTTPQQLAIPAGYALVRNDEIESLHAEMIALRDAVRRLAK